MHIELLNLNLLVPAVTIKALEKKLYQMEVNVQSIADKILHAPTSPPPLPQANNDALEKKVNQIKNEIESMVEKMLQALVGLNSATSLRLPTV